MIWQSMFLTINATNIKVLECSLKSYQLKIISLRRSILLSTRFSNISLKLNMRKAFPLENHFTLKINFTDNDFLEGSILAHQVKIFSLMLIGLTVWGDFGLPSLMQGRQLFLWFSSRCWSNDIHATKNVILKEINQLDF